MNQEQVRIEGPTRRTHWFRRPFYRKEGLKEVLQTKQLGWILFAVFVLALVTSLFQGPPVSIQRTSKFLQTESVQPNVLIPSQSEDAKPQPKPNSTSTARHASPKLFTGPQVVARPSAPIPAGTFVRAKLLTGASNGSVRAEVLESISTGGEVCLEAGSILVGQGSSTEERLFITFDSILKRDGGNQKARGQAFETEDRTLGLKGSLIGNRAAKVAGATALNFVGGLSEGLQEQEVKGGVAVRNSSLKNALLNGASKAALEESREILSGLRNKQPTIEVPEGKEILVLFEESR